MPFIKVALQDAKEPEAVPEGPYDLRIVKHEDGESKKSGNPMTTVFIKIEDAAHPTAALVRHWLVPPTHDTPADQRQMRLLDIRRFLTAFGVSMQGDGFDSDDLDGATASQIMLTQETNDETGDVYNRLKLPRLKE
jgi:hypothetical protein